MRSDILGDRFVQHANGSWCDLATGSAVDLVLAPLAIGWQERARVLEEEMWQRSTTLVDFGRVGATEWFEARAIGPAGPRSMDELSAANLAAREMTTVAMSLDTPGVRYVELRVGNGGDPLTTASTVARGLRAIGFVSVRPTVTIPAPCLAALSHRHVAILLCADVDGEHVSQWIRKLTTVSVRAHMVVRLNVPAASTTGPLLSIARERAPVDWDTRQAEPSEYARHPGSVTLRRAARSASRGRFRAAGRWYRAAVESARRHGGDVMQARACRELVQVLVKQDAWQEAENAAVPLLARIEDRRVWRSHAALVSEVFIARAEFRRAEALISAGLADAAATSEALPASLLLRQGELRFWQGRFEEADRIVRSLPSSVEACALDGLVAWARGDPARLIEAMAALDRRSPRDALQEFWRCGLAALTAALERPGGHEVETLTRAVVAASREVGGPRLERLGRVMAAEVLGSIDRCADASQILGQSSLWHRAPALDGLLGEWIRLNQDRDESQQMLSRLMRAGALGIRRWGSGRGRMNLVHAIPAVLQVVHEAEDELAALKASCHWMRRDGGAEAVAFLAAENRTIVAADGWTTADTAAVDSSQLDGARAGPGATATGSVIVTTPVRYAGVVLGVVAARGPVERAATLSEAARTIAALCAPACRSRLDAVSAARRSWSLTPEILGVSPAIVALRETIGRAAATPFAVLIEGESGTGKELVARAIHRLSPRRDRRFSAVNCAALTDELVEAELFGHSRGAFTGAIGPRVGLFEEANAGSLFLDEVSELSARAQAKLLRVLQEREVRRVGENAARPIDVRVIAATNQPLSEAVGRGAFREDLLFRLAVVRIRLPALRERPEDIPVLAQSIWRSLTMDAGKQVILGPDALAALCRHRWPGNVREFQNVMAAIVVLAPARGRVAARHVTQVMIGNAGDESEVLPLHHLRTRCERRAVSGALARHGGCRAAAARELGLTRQGLIKAMKRLGLEAEPNAAGVA